MKKRVAMLGVIGCLAAVAVVGGTFAADRTSTEGNAGTAIAEITTKSIGVAVNGDHSKKNETVEITDTAMPGAEYACKYNIVNSVDQGEDAYSIYTRVKVYKKWKNSDLDAKRVQIGRMNQSGEFVPYQEVKSNTMTENGWIITYNDGKELEMYYTRPLQKGETTSNLIDAVKLDDTLGNDYANQALEIQLEVDAVQSAVGEKAIQAEWGVSADISEDGTIQSISK